jgi:hypothetical protein
MAVTTLRDKDVSNKILMMPSITFYGMFLVLVNLANAEQRARLFTAFSHRKVSDETSDYDKTVAERVMATELITFYAVMLALISQADTYNLARFQTAFPEVVREAKIRYFAPDGCLSAAEWKEKNPDVDVDDDWLQEYFDKAIAKAG